MPTQRLLVLRIILVLIVTVMIGRLYQLQLVDTNARRYGSDNIARTTIRYVMISPRRGEILASDGATRLAQSVASFSIGVLPGRLPPVGSERRADVLGRLAQLSGITSTLTISPTLTPRRGNLLRNALTDLHIDPPETLTHARLHIAPGHTLDAIKMARGYSDVVTFENPINALIDSSTTRGYETVTVKEDISQSLALVVHENSTYLPGVVVEEDYRRRYPQSASLPSLSHLLGHIGRIDSCELVTENPTTSWLDSLIDVVSYTADCRRILNKHIQRSSAGMPLYKNDDFIGKDGLEASYEEVLRGTIGIEMIGVDALERPVSAARTLQPVTEGNDLVTTLDIDFQRQVQTILQRWIGEGEARRISATDHKRDYAPVTNGVALVMNARNGRVLATVSLPAYDNNVWVDRSRADELQNLLYSPDPERLAELTRLAPLTNRAIAGQYPPGSSLKPFVGAAALQKGVIAPDTELRDPGRIILEERGGHTFVLPNSVRRDNGFINVSDALKVSSNVFFASVGGGNDQATNLGSEGPSIRGLTISGLAEGLQWFGLGQPTSISLPGEAEGRVPTPNWKAHILREPWTTGDTYNTSIGQGYLEVTPLQMAVAMSALVNGGTVYRPQLVQAIIDSNGSIIEHIQPEIMSRIPVDEGYMAVMREGMRRSITEGINVAARDECSGLSIAGKTGTAEFGPNIITEDGNITRQSHAWFVGFAPYDNPEIVVVVLLEGTGDMDDGSSTLAVPAVTQIMQAYFGINPPEEPARECPALPREPDIVLAPATPSWATDTRQQHIASGHAQP